MVTSADPLVCSVTVLLFNGIIKTGIVTTIFACTWLMYGVLTHSRQHLTLFVARPWIDNSSSVKHTTSLINVTEECYMTITLHRFGLKRLGNRCVPFEKLAQQLVSLMQPCIGLLTTRSISITVHTAPNVQWILKKKLVW